MATRQVPRTQEKGRILTLKEASEYAKMGQRTLQRYIESGELRAGRIGSGPKGHYRIWSSDLDRFLFGEEQE